MKSMVWAAGMKLGKRKFGGATCKLGYSTSIPAHMRGNVIELSAVHCAPEHRRQGFATELLHQVCKEADAAEKVLFLMVKAGDGMTSEQLESWYADKFGFAVIQAEPRLMARMPGATPQSISISLESHES